MTTSAGSTRLLSRRWHLPPSRAIGLAQLAEQFDVHPNQITRGRRSLRAELPMCSVLVAARRHSQRST